MNCTPQRNEIKTNIEDKLSRHFGTSSADATTEQMYKAVAMTVKDILMEKQINFTPYLTIQKLI